jgi:hypothetical protein
LIGDEEQRRFTDAWEARLDQPASVLDVQFEAERFRGPVGGQVLDTSESS